MSGHAHAPHAPAYSPVHASASSRLSASIRYPHDPRILALFIPEKKDILRASYTVTDDGDAIVFTISADDATSLRAVTTTITKVLSVWEETSSHGAR